MKPRENITHFRQEKEYTCGAASIRAFLDGTEEEVGQLIGTKKSGTNILNVKYGLEKIGILSHYVSLNQDYRELFWLTNLSCHFPLYLGCEFVDQGKRGRPSVRSHAVLVANGKFYDPSETRECPIDAFERTFNKKMIISTMLVIDHELKDFRANMERLAE